MTLPGPSWGTQDRQKMVLGLPQSGTCTRVLVNRYKIVTKTTEHMGGSHRPLPLRGDWQGPMTSLLDPGVPWSTLEGQGPERVPQGPE